VATGLVCPLPRVGSFSTSVDSAVPPALQAMLVIRIIASARKMELRFFIASFLMVEYGRRYLTS
jgi:hypothetical protein